jgi:hypothetical protein
LPHSEVGRSRDRFDPRARRATVERSSGQRSPPPSPCSSPTVAERRLAAASAEIVVAVARVPAAFEDVEDGLAATRVLALEASAQDRPPQYGTREH